MSNGPQQHGNKVEQPEIRADGRQDAGEDGQGRPIS